MSTSSNITLNNNQERALIKMKDFIESSTDRCFILSGYAGTGKTTLIRHFIEYLTEKELNFHLLSTTGRAAKILSNYTNHNANTIHSLIYDFKGLNVDLSNIKEDSLFNISSEQIYIRFTPQISAKDISEAIYIVDEASMISNLSSTKITQALFGEGKLLTDLFNYDSKPKSKFIFVGDPCQLPPIEGNTSPALNAEYIKKTFNISCQTATLTDIERQKNSIVKVSQVIRTMWRNAPSDKKIYGSNNVWGILPISHYKDIDIYISEDEMQDDYVSIIEEYGYKAATYICQDNRQCNKISLIIRAKLGYFGSLKSGDLLLVQQNQLDTGLMNGDMVEVIKVTPHLRHSINIKDKTKYQVQLNFLEVEVKELSTGIVYKTLLIKEILEGSTNNLNNKQQTALFIDFIIRMKKKGITQKKCPAKFEEELHNDKYLNALRCTYGYAITCHKAQGGEWDNVFINFSRRNILLNPTKEIYQWIYTAITRGKKNVSFISDFYIR